MMMRAVSMTLMVLLLAGTSTYTGAPRAAAAKAERSPSRIEAMASLDHVLVEHSDAAFDWSRLLECPPSRVALFAPVTVRLPFRFREAKLSHILLHPSGREKYNKTKQEVDFEVAADAVTFRVPENWATMFSSNSEDYEPGRTLLGFTLCARSEEDDRWYDCYFVIRTDAGMSGFGGL